MLAYTQPIYGSDCFDPRRLQGAESAPLEQLQDMADSIVRRGKGKNLDAVCLGRIFHLIESRGLTGRQGMKAWAKARYGLESDTQVNLYLNIRVLAAELVYGRTAKLKALEIAASALPELQPAIIDLGEIKGVDIDVLRQAVRSAELALRPRKGPPPDLQAIIERMKQEVLDRTGKGKGKGRGRGKGKKTQAELIKDARRNTGTLRKAVGRLLEQRAVEPAAGAPSVSALRAEVEAVLVDLREAEAEETAVAEKVEEAAVAEKAAAAKAVAERRGQPRGGPLEDHARAGNGINGNDDKGIDEKKEAMKAGAGGGALPEDGKGGPPAPGAGGPAGGGPAGGGPAGGGPVDDGPVDDDAPADDNAPADDDDWYLPIVLGIAAALPIDELQRLTTLFGNVVRGKQEAGFAGTIRGFYDRCDLAARGVDREDFDFWADQLCGDDWDIRGRFALAFLLKARPPDWAWEVRRLSTRELTPTLRAVVAEICAKHPPLEVSGEFTGPKADLNREVAILRAMIARVLPDAPDAAYVVQRSAFQAASELMLQLNRLLRADPPAT